MHGVDSDDDGRVDGPDGREDRPQDGDRGAHVHAHDEDRVYGITTAETSHTQEITRRQKQYILTMLVRVVSIIVVVTVPGISWPVKIGLCIVATIIPYVAVVRANGGPSPEKGPTNLMLGQPRQNELGAAQRGLPGPGESADFIVGERVFREPPEGDAAQAQQASQGSTTGDPEAGEAAEDAAPDTSWASAARETVTPGQSAGGAAADAAFDQDPDPDPAWLRRGSGR